MKKILCVTYRGWACNIYDMLQEALPHYDFKIIRTKEDYSEPIIRNYNPDIILWYGWSWKIPKIIVGSYFSVCLHPSPLPKYRGGSPLQNQIIRGEKMSAVSIVRMSEGLDEGDIIRQIPLSLSGTIDDIFQRMTDIGFSVTYDFLVNGITLTKQNHEQATVYKRRKPVDSHLTTQELHNESAEYIYDKIRMLTGPYPCAYIEDFKGDKVFITGARL